MLPRLMLRISLTRRLTYIPWRWKLLWATRGMDGMALMTLHWDILEAGV